MLSARQAARIGDDRPRREPSQRIFRPAVRSGGIQTLLWSLQLIHFVDQLPIVLVHFQNSQLELMTDLHVVVVVVVPLSSDVLCSPSSPGGGGDSCWWAAQTSLRPSNQPTDRLTDFPAVRYVMCYLAGWLQTAQYRTLRTQVFVLRKDTDASCSWSEQPLARAVRWKVSAATPERGEPFPVR